MSEARAKLKSRGKRFSKFSVVGLSNAAIDVGVLNLFLWLEPTREVTLLDQQWAVLGASPPDHRLHGGADLSRQQRRQDHLRNGRIDHQLLYHALRCFLPPALVQRPLVRAPTPC
jgi:hypothetical protein